GVAIGLTGNQDMSGTCSCHDKSPSVVLSNGFIGFSRFKLFCPISVNRSIFLLALGQECFPSDIRGLSVVNF
ncbi:MAG: hypothetical protein ACYTE0_12265, partial [Planctomycetota bacterium]